MAAKDEDGLSAKITVKFIGSSLSTSKGLNGNLAKATENPAGNLETLSKCFK
jgi:hypothetical protein